MSKIIILGLSLFFYSKYLLAMDFLESEGKPDGPEYHHSSEPPENYQDC